MARPRDERIDQAVLDAAREVLREVGYSGLTLEAVATRATTTRPAIRRRWPTAKHLVVDVITLTAGSSPTPDTGCTHCDLVIGIEGLRRSMVDPLLRLTLPSLVADLHDNAPLRELFLQQFFRPRRQTTALAIARGIERGDLRPDADVDLLLDLLASAITYRVLFGHLDLEAGLGEDIVRIVMRGIATPHWIAHHEDALTGSGRHA